MRTLFFPLAAFIVVLPGVLNVLGQQPAVTLTENDQNTSTDIQSTYVLAADDQISIWALGVPEIVANPIRIGPSGQIDLPLVGLVNAGGLSIEQLKQELGNRLKEYVQEPQVSVTVVELRSQPVSVLGAVKIPGVYLLHGPKTLVEVLALAGGLQNDAGAYMRITRRVESGRIPLPGSKYDPTGQFSVADVTVKAVMESGNPDYNIPIRPHDVISIPRAQMVYVMGEVIKPGGFILNEKETMSVLQALSVAGGINRSAAPKKARILRVESGTTERKEIHFDLKKILSGTSGDVALHAEDILFIPNNTAKAVGVRTIEAAVQVGVLAIFGR
jgi:polysaccharide biosynthesis/export protein